MLFGLLSAPLSDMHALRKKLYTVSDCRITEIRISYSYRSRSWKPVELRQAITKDDQGFTWVAALPKDLRDVSEGTKCLVVIYDTEDVINRSKRDKMPVYRREIVVL